MRNVNIDEITVGDLVEFTTVESGDALILGKVREVYHITDSGEKNRTNKKCFVIDRVENKMNSGVLPDMVLDHAITDAFVSKGQTAKSISGGVVDKPNIWEPTFATRFEERSDLLSLLYNLNKEDVETIATYRNIDNGVSVNLLADRVSDDNIRFIIQVSNKERIVGYKSLGCGTVRRLAETINEFGTNRDGLEADLKNISMHVSTRSLSKTIDELPAEIIVGGEDNEVDGFSVSGISLLSTAELNDGLNNLKDGQTLYVYSLVSKDKSFGGCKDQLYSLVAIEEYGHVRFEIHHKTFNPDHGFWATNEIVDLIKGRLDIIVEILSKEIIERVPGFVLEYAKSKEQSIE